MIKLFKSIFNKKNSKMPLHKDGCPAKCPECGNKALTITRRLDMNNVLYKMYVSCSICRKQLGRIDKNKWTYSK